VGFRSGEDHSGERGTSPAGAPVPPEAERGRERRGRGPWILLLAVVVLLALLITAAVLIWRSFGDSLSGTSVARDSIDSGPSPRIRLTNGPGQIRIEGVKNSNSVQYEVTKHAQASDPATAKKRASEVPIDLSRDNSAFVLETDGGRGAGADYVLQVPSGSSVDVTSEAGDVEATGLSGSVAVQADAGDVTVKDVGGPVKIKSPKGDVDLSNMRTDTGQANLEVGSGDVTLQDLVVGTLETSVEAGDVTLSGRFSGGGRVSVQTGSINAKLPPEDTRELTLEARIGQVTREDGRSKDEPKKSGKGG
jgi:hypothetical protein